MHDSWSELAVHVAMDMVVVIEDISKGMMNIVPLVHTLRARPLG